MSLSRRHLLQFFAASAAMATVRKVSAIADPSSCNAPLGALETWVPDSGWGAYGKPRKVLEIFLRGGASLYNSFWYDEELGGSSGTGDTPFDNWTPITGGSTPGSNDWMGGTIGPAAAPLFTPVDPPSDVPPPPQARVTTRKLSSFMRVVRVAHELTPHEAAIPYAATGTTLGRPKMSGLGAAIWRRTVERSCTSGIGSLVLQAGGRVGDDRAANSLASCGLHGPEYRPPIIKLGDPALRDALPRTNFSLAQMEDLKSFYRNRYEPLLRRNGVPVRSEGWTAYQASLDMLQNQHGALYNLLSAPGYDDLFDPIAAENYGYGDSKNFTWIAIKRAVEMLRDSSDLQHVAVVDGGVEADYDTHKPTGSLTVARIHNGNIWNVCDALSHSLNAILDHGIVVLIQSEFGRKETENNTGTEHHPFGYANVVIGDIVPAGWSGDVDSSDDSVASYDSPAADHPSALTPTDVHAAVAQLAGIKPWQNDDMFDKDLSCTNGGQSSRIVLGLDAV